MRKVVLMFQIIFPERNCGEWLQHLSIYLSINLSVHPSIHPSILLCIYPTIHFRHNQEKKNNKLTREKEPDNGARFPFEDKTPGGAAFWKTFYMRRLPLDPSLELGNPQISYVQEILSDVLTLSLRAVNQEGTGFLLLCSEELSGCWGKLKVQG